MKYSLQQIDEIRSTILRIKLKRDELEELSDEVNNISKDPEERYVLSFYYTREERVFNIPTLSLLDLYESKITNLKLEIESLEKRLQKLVK